MHILKLLSASALALTLVACGGGSSSPTPTASSTAGPTPPPPPPPEEKTCAGNTQNSMLEAAIRNGNVSALEDVNVIMTDILETAECGRELFNDSRIKLFNLSSDGTITTNSLTSISWNPTHDAAFMQPIFGQSEAVLYSNDTWRSDGRIDNSPLAVIGQTGETRHMVLGGNPMRNLYRDGASVNEQMQDYLRNSLSWLTGRDDLTTAPFKAVIAQMDQSRYFPDRAATRQWLDNNYSGMVSYNDAQACDADAMIACLNDNSDILIISQNSADEAEVEAVSAAVDHALANGIPVLYMHLDGGLLPLGEALLPKLQASYGGDNYWARQRLGNYNAAPDFGKLPATISSRLDLIKRFQDSNFTINFADCENNSCLETSGYAEQFFNAARDIQREVDGFDSAGINLFEQDGQRFTKALVLLADSYRQQVSFPMDKMTTPQTEFLSSLYADMVVHTARDFNPAQGDMGNFSRSDFSHVTPVTKDVTLTARDRYKAAGVYALPGQTVTVTRNDSSDVNTHIKVNMVRSGSTHIFDEDRYNRPKYMTSRDLPIAAGETISFTSPYGGPVQIRFDAKDVDVSFTFENVGEHAIWRGPEDDLSFAAKMDAGDYDWAELITPSFQVHSKLEKMRDTITDPLFGSAPAIGAATETQIHNYPHIMAGFKGAGIEVVAEVHDWAASKGLDIHTLDRVKHMNADQATCGYGCSGNPYDAYWSFNPIGHGDIHELGHGLERHKFRFAGQEGHTITNPYSYYSKWRYHENTGTPVSEIGCQNLPYEDMFNIVQASRNEADPFAYMQAQDLTVWNRGAAINHQIMMAAQDLGLLDDGRMMLVRLHIIEREFNIADNNDEAWAAKRDALGFGSFTRSEARELSNNDWLLIAMSHLLERDMSDYIQLWGYELTDAAKTHVAAWNYPIMPTDYYVASPTQHCDSFEGLSKLSVDGTQNWPASNSKQKPLTPYEKQKASDHVCTHDEE